MYNFYINSASIRDCIVKFLILIKHCFLLIIIPFLSVSASGHSQGITLSKKDVPLIEVFSELRKQSNYDFAFTEKQLSNTHKVTVSVKNASINEVLEICFKGQPLAYSINNNTITIKRKDTSLFESIGARFRVVTITGSVVDTLGKPLSGAIVKIQGKSTTVRTNEQGNFTIISEQDKGVLAISFLGYKTQEINFSETNSGPFKIILKELHSSLQEVEVVSTGYQSLPKERATGSFVLIDNELLNRKVGSTILERLDGVTSGLIFNQRRAGNNSEITVRGRSTIFANVDPLIVVDNFPYEGDIGNINPSDIENITILKDAAAASIWGSRAGNGVIVITTKKGKAENKTKISLVANTTISGKPDLFYKNQMNSSDYIDLEQYLFQKGYYNTTINNGYGVISPAVAVMLQKRNKEISPSDSALRINNLKGLDVREDLEKYIYRSSVKQQYAINLNGGNINHLYYISAGYDKDLQNTFSSNYNRFTLNANNTYYLFGSKLKLFAGVLLSNSTSKDNDTKFTSTFTPYDQLADNEGNHLSIVRSGGLRKQYTDTTGKGQLLDWDYRPLDENYSNSISTLTDYKLNANLEYTIFQGLSVSVNYQYQKGINEYSQIYGSDSFYSRNLINSFTQLNHTTLVATRPVPLGAINNTSNNNYNSNYGRAQINYSNKFGENHDLNALGGLEIKDYQGLYFSNRFYGFNTSDASSIPVNNAADFRQYFGSGAARISSGDSQNFSVDRFRSFFFNASYIYNKKYTFSTSARRDESNIFGVKANQKGVPLWSAGLLWNIEDENFYNSKLIPELKARVTYGYNGNVDRSTSAYLTARNSGVNAWRQPVGVIVNPPNPSLQWERVKNINFGLDFSSKSNLFSGSLDYFIKNGLDLIGNSPIAPQSGISEFKGNSANTKTSGFDLVINKKSVKNNLLKWQSNLLFSYNNEVITSYKVKQGRNSDIVSSNYANPLEGYPYNAVFSYLYQGLDNQGKPLGLLNGEITQNFSAINGSTNTSNLIYMGSSIPTIYGSFRNSFLYNGFNISFNITYKLNYYFRRSDAFSGSSYSYRTSDYDKRWQSPGDELNTIVPALIYPVNSAQDGFVKGSNVLVEKGDHIRFQDIQLSYKFKPERFKSILTNFQIYTYVNNIGIIWKATKRNIDPDASEFPSPITISFGLSTNF